MHFIELLDITSSKLDLIYSITQENISGNSRYEAMSGAFGALGGNLSAIHINPAASAVFNTSEFGLQCVTLKPKTRLHILALLLPHKIK